MSVFQNKNKIQIEKYLQNFPQVNYYHLGDLDDFFWEHTTWYVNKSGDDFSALLLLYSGLEPPVLLAIENNNAEEMRQLILNTLPQFPKKIYSHLSPGYEKLFEDAYGIENCGNYLKMFWQHPEYIDAIETQEIFPLTLSDLVEIQDLFKRAYPGNFFEARMLETGQYVGLRDKKTKTLIGVAGVHVYSAIYQIAALGNITVDPEFRGKGYGIILVAGLCKKLSDTVNVIGLNVKANNVAAIRAYKKCGFEIVAEYGEFMLTAK